MDDFKKLTEQLLEIYINAESVNDLEIENKLFFIFTLILFYVNN